MQSATGAPAETLASGRTSHKILFVMSQQHLDRLGRSPLHYAAGKGDVADVLDHLKAGEEPKLADANGWTPLHFAAQAGSALVIRTLVSAGAVVDSRDAHGNTPLSTATFNSRGIGDAILALRKAGADPHAINKHGVSSVSLARQIANYDVAQFFADVPADPAAAT
jgi:ankyrin repeat protein